MYPRKSIILASALTLPLAVALAHETETRQRATDAAEPKIFAAAELKWTQNPPSLPAGAQIVVLDGDPRADGPFTIRLKMPPGYKIPPHTHPTAERVTVVSGTVQLGIGGKFDESAGRKLNAGDFVVVPAGVPHFAWSTSEAVLQIHGEGPFQRKFVDPAHDPAKR